MEQIVAEPQGNQPGKAAEAVVEVVQFRTFREVVGVNTKNWYRKEADSWTKLGNKFRSVGKDFFRRLGRNTCGQ
jgi:hypothetical protein